MMISRNQSNFCALLCGFFILIFAHVQAFVCGSSLEIMGGYRNDDLKTSLHGHDSLDESFGSQSINAKNISIWEFGLKGRYVFGDNWLIKGYAIGGVITEGNYSEHFNLLSDQSQKANASIHHGTTSDFSVALGYLFQVQECGFFDFLQGPFAACEIEFSQFGPVVGWSWDNQHVKIGDIYQSSFSALDMLSYKTHWNGPWLGFEADFCKWDLLFYLNYEFHWATWKGRWESDCNSLSSGALTDRWRSHRGYGNVVEFGVDYPFCNGITLGLDLKWQGYWTKKRKDHARGGSSSSSNANDLLRSSQNSWRSIGIQLNLGYGF